MPIYGIKTAEINPKYSPSDALKLIKVNGLNEHRNWKNRLQYDLAPIAVIALEKLGRNKQAKALRTHFNIAA